MKRFMAISVTRPVMLAVCSSLYELSFAERHKMRADLVVKIQHIVICRRGIAKYP